MVRAVVEGLVLRRMTVAAAIAVVVLPLGLGISQLKLADDALGFLPASDSRVSSFLRVGEEFGLLRTILVGVRAPEGDPSGLFTPSRLSALHDLTARVGAVPGIGNVLSLANVVDMTPGADGPEVRALLGDVSALDAGGVIALREKTLSRAHLVGSLVSADGDSALIVVTPAAGIDPSTLVPLIRQALDPPAADLHFMLGGAPAVAAAVSGVASGDAWLGGVVALVLVFGLVLALRPKGALVALVPGALGSVTALGVAGWAHLPVPSFAALGALVAVGAGAAACAPWVAAHVDGMSMPRAAEALGWASVTGPLIGATAMAALVLSAVEPLGTSGLVVGSALALTAILVVPVLVVAFGAEVAQPARAVLGSLLRRPLVRVLGSGRALIAAQIVALLVIGGFFFAARGYIEAVGVDLDLERSLPPDSEAVAMQRFQATEVGGAHLLIVELKGDMRDPHVLRVMRTLQDRITLVPGVRSTRSFADVVALAGFAMLNRPGLPPTSGAVEDVMALLDGNPLVGALADDGRTAALLLVEVAVPSAEVVGGVLRAVQGLSPGGNPLVARLVKDDPAVASALATEVAYGVAAAAVRAGAPVPAPAAIEALARTLEPIAGELPPPTAELAAPRIAELLESPLFPVDLTLVPPADEDRDAADGASSGPDFAAAARAIVAAVGAVGRAPEVGMLETKLKELFPYPAADAEEGEYFPQAARRLQQELQDLSLAAFVEARTVEIADAMSVPSAARPVAGLAAALAGAAAVTGIVPAPGRGMGGPAVDAEVLVTGAPVATTAAAAHVTQASLWVLGAGLGAAVGLLVLALGWRFVALFVAIGAVGASLYALALVSALGGARDPIWPFALASALALAASLGGAACVQRRSFTAPALAAVGGVGFALAGSFFVLLGAAAPAAAQLGAGLGLAALLAAGAAILAALAWGIEDKTVEGSS